MFWFSFPSNLSTYHLTQGHSFAWYTLHISSAYPSTLSVPTSDPRLVSPHQFFPLWWHFCTNVTCKIDWLMVESSVWLHFLSIWFILCFSCTRLSATYVTKIMFWTLVCVSLWFTIVFSSFPPVESSAVADSFNVVYASVSSRFWFGLVLCFSPFVLIIFVISLHLIILGVSQLISSWNVSSNSIQTLSSSFTLPIFACTRSLSFLYFFPFASSATFASASSSS